MSTNRAMAKASMSPSVKTLGKTALAQSKKSGPQSSDGGENIKKLPLCDTYPANSVLELTLSPNDEIVRGLVFCTDERSNTIVLKTTLKHTILTSDIRIVNASCIRQKRVIKKEAPKTNESGSVWSKSVTTRKNNNDDTDTCEELAIPLSSVSKKSLDDREKRALKIAEAGFLCVNQKVYSSYLSFFTLTYIQFYLHSLQTFKSSNHYKLGNTRGTGSF